MFSITDLTKNHKPPLSTVCTYRVLLLLIVFVLYSDICNSIQMKKGQTPNATEDFNGSVPVLLGKPGTTEEVMEGPSS